MKLAHPSLIAEIDAYAQRTLGISEEILIRRAGEAIAECALLHLLDKSASVLILAGGGNNGADGYAAALALRAHGFFSRVVDLLGKGQRSEGGRAVLEEYRRLVGEPLSWTEAKALCPDMVIDAVFGTGFSGDAPPVAQQAALWAKDTGAFVLAVDVPLGVDAAWGSVKPYALRADLTVVLSYMKTGLLSYPAAAYLGDVVLKDIGLDVPAVHRAFPSLTDATDDAYVLKHLPRRAALSHKGSFGRALLFVGSSAYRGAAHLASEAALRGGVGLLTVVSEGAVTDSLLPVLPEALYRTKKPFSLWTDADVEDACALADTADAVLVGCGCGKSEMLCRFILSLLACEGAPLVLDADAINSLADAGRDACDALKAARREVLLTPHPLEFSRLSGLSVSEVQENRMRIASDFAEGLGVSLLLKGARTVIATPKGVSVNLSGSSALAKGGTGDVLAGLVTALLAQGATPEAALRIGAYLHGKAADSLSSEESEYGVLPSALPRQIAMEIKNCINANKY